MKLVGEGGVVGDVEGGGGNSTPSPHERALEMNIVEDFSDSVG